VVHHSVVVHKVRLGRKEIDAIPEGTRASLSRLPL
jgi:hypothetical protein